MKNLFKNISNLFLLITLFFSFSTFGKSIALITSVTGKAFILDGYQMKEAVSGDLVTDLSEIMTEEGAQITFSDYYDHQFHLAGQGQIKFFNRLVELKRGILWIQSIQTNDASFVVQTANSQTQFSRGEGILSFDQSSGKTQLVVLDGDFQMENLLLKGLQVRVSEGFFSFVDDKYESGAPRYPTPIGQQSFQKLLGLFSNISPMDKNARLVRETIAEEVKVKTPPLAPEKSRLPASKPTTKPGSTVFLGDKESLTIEKEQKLLEFYDHKMMGLLKKPAPKKKTYTNYDKQSDVKVRVFSRPSKVAKAPKVMKNKQVLPRDVAQVKDSMERKVKVSSEFEGSLMDNYKNQMRHSNEVNKLIDDLDSVKIDYKTDY